MGSNQASNTYNRLRLVMGQMGAICMSFDHRAQNDPDVLALEMFNRAFFVGQMKRLLGLLIGRKRRLLVLDEVLRGRQVLDREMMGVQTVRLASIQGTVSRPDLFDSEFYPMNRSTRNRWISVAAGMIANRAGLPQPDLVLVDDVYFVEDGHHRVSVAWRMGHLFLDANVSRLHLQEAVSEVADEVADEAANENA